MDMQKKVPHLWFEWEARDAAEFYTAIFPNSKITSSVELHDTPSGDTQIITFNLSGYTFMAINGGSNFKFNPAISFMVNFDPSRDDQAQENLDALWMNLAQGGIELMPLQEYPFSKRYGWIRDKYGLSWQLILKDPTGDERPFIVPSLMFVQEQSGKAEEAGDYYLSVFKNSRRGQIARYPADMEPDLEGAVMFSDFMLEHQWFAAMHSGQQHDFTFNDAVSFLLRCKNQNEIDYFWDKLSADPQAEQCGWLKDRYGLSWQISPVLMEEMMEKGTQEQLDRVTSTFLQMKKFDLEKLKAAYNG